MFSRSDLKICSDAVSELIKQRYCILKKRAPKSYNSLALLSSQLFVTLILALCRYYLTHTDRSTSRGGEKTGSFTYKNH